MVLISASSVDFYALFTTKLIFLVGLLYLNMPTFKYSRVEKEERDPEELLATDQTPLWATRKWRLQLFRCWPLFAHAFLLAVYSSATFYYISQYKPSDQVCAKQLSSYCMFYVFPGNYANFNCFQHRRWRL